MWSTSGYPDPDLCFTRISVSNGQMLYNRLASRLPCISIFSFEWFMFTFEGYLYSEVEEKFMDIDRKVAEEKRVLCPPVERIWRWSELIPNPMDVSVVIVGKHPYTQVEKGVPKADGLAFSVSSEYYGLTKRLSSTQVDIWTMVTTCPRVFVVEDETNRVREGNLEYWCKQGVLLLNNTLTAPGGKNCANAHKDFGWQFVTDAVIRKLGSKSMPNVIVFLLWGEFAYSKIPLIYCKETISEEEKNSLPPCQHYRFNRVLKWFHPSQLSVNVEGRYMHLQFVVCNILLLTDGRNAIAWY